MTRQLLFIFMICFTDLLGAETLKGIYCSRVVTPDIIWQIGKELDSRYQRTERRLVTGQNQELVKRLELRKSLILRALLSAQRAWENPNNSDLVMNAVIDYTVVIDHIRLHHSQPPAFGESFEQKLDQYRKSMKWHFQHVMSLTGRPVSFDFGISSWEQVLMSWALMEPMIALSQSTLNDYDTTVGASLASLATHDFVHYWRGHLQYLKGQAPQNFFFKAADVSSKDLKAFRKKVHASAHLILRLLEIVIDTKTFPRLVDRQIARSIVFQALHEVEPPWISLENWTQYDPDEKNRLLQSVAIRVNSGFYEIDRSHLAEINPEKFSPLFDRIVRELRRQSQPSWIPPELAKPSW